VATNRRNIYGAIVLGLLIFLFGCSTPLVSESDLLLMRKIKILEIQNEFLVQDYNNLAEKYNGLRDACKQYIQTHPEI
jgi:hypothetical protein